MGVTQYSKQCDRMKKDLVLVGGGGHCKSCIDVIEQTDLWKIVAILDRPEKRGEAILNYTINGSDEDIPAFAEQGCSFLITLGQIKSPFVRIKLFEKLTELKAHLPVIISPYAYVSPYASVGAGTIVLHHALINTNATVGSNCIINSKSLIEHDATVGDHCHISTGAVLNGGVQMGSGNFMGSSAVTKEYITIGDRNIIGAGARIMKDIANEQGVI